MAKLISIITKQPLDWNSWLLSKKLLKKAEESSARMTQIEAWSIFSDLVSSKTAQQAFELLNSRIGSRKHLSNWLGQIGHRQDVRLGAGRDFSGYMKAVSRSLWSRSAGL